MGRIVTFILTLCLSTAAGLHCICTYGNRNIKNLTFFFSFRTLFVMFIVLTGQLKKHNTGYSIKMIVLFCLIKMEKGRETYKVDWRKT